MIDLLEDSLRRRDALALGDSDALRLIDGAGDGLPGLYLDVFAGSRLVSTTGGGISAPLREWLARHHHPTYWKKLDQHEKAAPAHLCGPPARSPFPISEHGARYLISFEAGYSQGLFLDQRDNRRRVRERCRPGETVLNTFAYTGGFSISAALAGAITTTLDLSQQYLDWARDNFRQNELDPADHHFCKGDTFHWLRRFAKQGRTFDGIVLDPPTFSRDDRGRVFRVEQDYGALVALATACLKPSGWLLCTTNCRRLSRDRFEAMVREALPGTAKVATFPMPPDFTDAPYLKTVLVDR